MQTLPPPIANPHTGHGLQWDALQQGRGHEIAQRLRLALRRGFCTPVQVSQALTGNGTGALLAEITTERLAQLVCPPNLRDTPRFGQAPEPSVIREGLDWVRVAARERLLSASDLRAITQAPPTEIPEQISRVVARAFQATRSDLAAFENADTGYETHIQTGHLRVADATTGDEVSRLGVSFEGDIGGLDFSVLFSPHVSLSDRRIALELIHRVVEQWVLPDQASPRGHYAQFSGLEMHDDYIREAFDDAEGDFEEMAHTSPFEEDTVKDWIQWQKDRDEKPEWLQPIKGQTSSLTKKITHPGLRRWAEKAALLMHRATHWPAIREHVWFPTGEQLLEEDVDCMSHEADEWCLALFALTGNRFILDAAQHNHESIMSVGIRPEYIVAEPGHEHTLMQFAFERAMALNLLVSLDEQVQLT